MSVRKLLLVVSLLMPLMGCGRNPVGNGPDQSISANWVLRKTIPTALAADPRARFYLLVGHAITPDGTLDAAATTSYWVVNYAFPDPTNGHQATLLTYTVTPDGQVSLARKDHSPMPVGFDAMAPSIPRLDSSAMVDSAHRQGLFVGRDVPLIRLYSPLQAKYYNKLLYYVGDAPDLIVLQADTATPAN